MDGLLRPIQRRNEFQRLRTIWIFTAVVFAAAVWTGARMGNMFVQSDTADYIAIAEGRPAMLPFAARQLGPLIARALMHLLHLPVQRAFMWEGIAALVFFILATAFLLVRSDTPRWTIWAVAGLMFWGFQFNALVMPDLLYAALLCGFMLLLREGQVMAACLMMFPLTLTRESTLLTLACFLLAGAGGRRLKWREAAAAVLATGAALVVVKRLTTDALPNKEHISPLLYLAAKMPWNFLRNVLGIGMWANVYPACEAPKWQTGVHLGPLKAIGVCGFYPPIVGETLGIGMAIFGLLPLLMWRLRKLPFWSDGREHLMLRFALLYGTVSFLAAPLLGERLPRLYGYGWPLFLVAVPLLLGRSLANFRSARAAVAFLALHFFAAWSLMWAYPARMFPVGAICWISGWILLRRTFDARLPEGPGCGGVLPLAAGGS
jgi:hypothetical protein